MENNDNIVLYRYKKCVQKYCPVLEDLFSFILKMFAGNVSISCEADDDITQCQIHSSDELNAILTYNNNISHVHSMRSCENYLRRLISGKSSFIVKLESTEIAVIGNQHQEENRCGCLMNNILNDIFSVILDVMVGTALFTTETRLNSRVYNVFASPKRPSVFLVHSDCVTDEQMNCEKVPNLICWEVSGDVKTPSIGKISLTDVSHLKTPKGLYTAGRPHECGKSCRCSSQLKTEESIHICKSHDRLHTGERPYKCKYCEKTFSLPSFTIRHERSHTGERPYRCKYCEKAFSCSSGLKYHETLHTGEKPYKCKYCEKTFSRPSLIIGHERSHTGERPYRCKYCEKAYSYATDVKYHEMIHTGEKPFKCKYCEKTFSRPSESKRHERSHTGERPYKCKYCEKTFLISAHVKQHERLHTGERPYKCNFCEKTFSYTSEVRIHERLHNGGRSYKCQFCAKVFGNSSFFKVHVERHNV